MRYLTLPGRILFALIFLISAPSHFTAKTIAYAASQGVPAAHFFVPLSGVLALVGGVSVLFGFRARVGAWLLVMFLVPVTMAMHAFWLVGDPQTAMLQRAMFFKNLSMLGGALLVAYFGAGPVSVDEWLLRRHVERAPLPAGV